MSHKLKKIVKRFYKNKQRSTTAVFVILFAVVGVSLLVLTRAASPTKTIEPEDATVNNPATVINNGSASGGQAVQFNKPTLTNSARLGISPGSPFIGSELPGISEDAFWTKTKELGVGWIRVDVSMSNTGNVNAGDTRVQMAQKYGFKMVATLLGGNLNDHQGWANYAGRLVDRWNDAYPGVVQAIEPVNEVNGTYGQFGNGAPDYTDLLKKTYAAVKAQNSAITVISSGLAPAGGNWAAHSTDSCASDGGWRNPATFLEEMYKNNGNSSSGLFDAVGYHPYDSDYTLSNNYGGGPCNSGGYRPTHWMRKVMNSHGDSTKKIWATEAGWQPKCGNETTSVNWYNWDMNDWFYGVHDANGKSIGTNPAGGDWNTGPWMIYKLYQVYDQPQWGIIYKSGACGSGYHQSSLFTAIQNFAKKNQ